MATYGSFTSNAITASGVTRSTTFAWSLKEQSVANNTSTITWTLKGSGPEYGYMNGQTFNINVNGHITSSPERRQIKNGFLIASGTRVITHAANGTGSFSASMDGQLYYYGKANIWGSG